jgi:acyl-CoA synthetase (AMP-forming)/AMP-acid ligase II
MLRESKELDTLGDSMAGWNFAELWERIASKQPDAEAQVQGDRRVSWSEFDRRADGLARHLLDQGAQHQDKVAVYLYNCPEYLETTFACYKAGLVPVNTNYRYVEDELAYLWDNADAVAIVFHGCFTDRVAAVRNRVPTARTWLWVDDGSGPCPDWAFPYEVAAATETDGHTVAPWGRSGDDILMIYTGGTTGMPKGTMWRQDDLIRALCATGNPVLGEECETAGYDAALETIGASAAPGLPACPLMHGTGWFTANMYLTNGGSVVCLPSRHLDIPELLDVVEQEKIAAVTIVGDAFAKPIVAALDAEPDRWDISSIVLITSSGVMWSESAKLGLLAHHPNMMLIDSFSSSEAIGLGQSVSAGDSAADTASFALGVAARVVRDDGSDVEPGSGERGRVAVGGHVPIGYYKDPEKSASTFIQIDGKSYSCPGDWATVEADGSITLLGRGSVCINTAGEKVFPEEVEEALKTHASVYDAVVVGVPDDRFGETIAAVVQPTEGSSIDADELVAHTKHSLAGYKAPRMVLVVDSIGRAPNAKVDYKRWKSYAAEHVGA